MAVVEIDLDEVSRICPFLYQEVNLSCIHILIYNDPILIISLFFAKRTIQPFFSDRKFLILKGLTGFV